MITKISVTCFAILALSLVSFANQNDAPKNLQALVVSEWINILIVVFVGAMGGLTKHILVSGNRLLQDRRSEEVTTEGGLRACWRDIYLGIIAAIATFLMAAHELSSYKQALTALASGLGGSYILSNMYEAVIRGKSLNTALGIHRSEEAVSKKLLSALRELVQEKEDDEGS